MTHLRASCDRLAIDLGDLSGGSADGGFADAEPAQAALQQPPAGDYFGAPQFPHLASFGSFWWLQ